MELIQRYNQLASTEIVGEYDEVHMLMFIARPLICIIAVDSVLTK